MTVLLNTTITTAVTGAVTQMVSPVDGEINNVVLQANFTYGSGGTSADFYVQTSVDGGLTWTDVAEFNFLLASGRRLYNLSTAAVGTQYTPTDGTLTANTSKDGLLGPIWRVKYTTVGTYAGNTTIRVDAIFNGSQRVILNAGG